MNPEVKSMNSHKSPCKRNPPKITIDSDAGVGTFRALPRLTYRARPLAISSVKKLIQCGSGFPLVSATSHMFSAGTMQSLRLCEKDKV